jgi:hypothetical protein
MPAAPASEHAERAPTLHDSAGRQVSIDRPDPAGDATPVEDGSRRITAHSDAAIARAGGRLEARTITLVAYPFESFSLLNSFLTALSGVAGVAFAAPRRFRGGTLQLAVEYSGEEPLSARILRLSRFQPRVEVETYDSLTLAIEGA